MSDNIVRLGRDTFKLNKVEINSKFYLNGELINNKDYEVRGQILKINKILSRKNILEIKSDNNEYNYINFIEYDYFIEHINDNLLDFWFYGDKLLKKLICKIDNNEIYLEQLSVRDDVTEAFKFDQTLFPMEGKYFKLDLSCINFSYITVINPINNNIIFSIKKNSLISHINKKLFLKDQGYYISWNNQESDYILNPSSNLINYYSIESNEIIDFEKITLIIPIYDGYQETIDCIESVLKSKNKIKYDLVLINDFTKNRNLKEYISSLKQKNIHLVNKKKNTGFSDSVNLGSHFFQNRNIIILNSDTIVGDFFIDNLHYISKNNPDVGTITPVTNNGELATIPCLDSIHINHKSLVANVNNICNELYSDQGIDSPVCIGFCTYINRKCWNEIGGLDALTWGRGYGEEVDFSIKSGNLGWRHLISASTFVYHKGGTSFGHDKELLLKANQIKINEFYPGYDSVISNYSRNNKLSEFMSTLSLSIIFQNTSKKFDIHVSHDYGGGTEKFILDLISKTSNPCIYIRNKSNNTSELNFYNLEFLEGVNVHIEIIESENLQQIFEILSNSCNSINLHSTINFSDNLINLFKKLSYNSFVHDFTWLCPMITLTDSEGNYCNDNLNPKICESCINRSNGPREGVKNIFKDIVNFRNSHEQILRKSTSVYTGSVDASKRILKYYNINVEKIPYENIISTPKNKKIKNHTITIGILGAISIEKGFKKILDFVEFTTIHDENIKFILFGYTPKDFILDKYKSVNIYGKYNDKDIKFILSQYEIDFFWFPNQWPETYSYTLSIAFENSIWPVVNNIGAPAERVTELNFGTIVDLDISNKDLLAKFKSLKNKGYYVNS